MNARVAALWSPASAASLPNTVLTRIRYSFVARRRWSPAMASGEIDVGYTGGTAVVGAVASGADFKVLSALNNRVTYELGGQTGHQNAARFARTRDSAFRPSAARCGWALFWLWNISDLDPDRDKISILAVGDQNVLAQALAPAPSTRRCSTACKAGRLAALAFPPWRT